MVFEKIFFAQNGAKIILNMIQGTKMVFYYRIRELKILTKLNLIIEKYDKPEMASRVVDRDE